jgi:hypothetical protein
MLVSAPAVRTGAGVIAIIASSAVKSCWIKSEALGEH